MKKHNFNVLLVSCILLLVNIFLPSSGNVFAEEFASERPQGEQVIMQKGWVDALSEDMIVIDDLSSPLSSVTIYDQNGFIRRPSSLTVGQYIAFKRKSGKTVIHLLSEQVERPGSSRQASQSRNSGEEKKTIQQVDGVWKN